MFKSPERRRSHTSVTYLDSPTRRGQIESRQQERFHVPSPPEGMPDLQLSSPQQTSVLIPRSLTTMVTHPEYSLNDAISELFAQASATREACDTKAKDLVGGNVLPVAVQGCCSYSVYAGPELKFVVQFRLKSLALKPEIATLAREIHGAPAPNAVFRGRVGRWCEGTSSRLRYGSNSGHQPAGLCSRKWLLQELGPEPRLAQKVDGRYGTVWWPTLPWAFLYKSPMKISLHPPTGKC